MIDFEKAVKDCNPPTQAEIDIETNIHNKLLERRRAERIEERAVKLLSGGQG